MSLKLKRVLFILISALLVSCVSLCFVVRNNNSTEVSAQTIETSIEDVQDIYTLNAAAKFPASIQVDYAGETITAVNGVVVYPNGYVYQIVEDKDFTLSVMGNYTLKYYYTSDDSNLCVVTSFEVNDNLFNISHAEGDGSEYVIVQREIIESKYQEFRKPANWPAQYQGLTEYEMFRELFVRFNEGNTAAMFDKITNNNNPGMGHVTRRLQRILAGHFYSEFFPDEESLDLAYLSSASNTTSVNETTSNDGLILRLAPGAKFTLAEPINLNARGDSIRPELTSIATIDPRLMDVADKNGVPYVTETGARDPSRYTVNAEGFILTLTDCYDPTRYIKITSQNVAHYYSFMAGTDTLPSVHLTTQKFAYSADFQPVYYGEQYYTACKNICRSDSMYYDRYNDMLTGIELLYDPDTCRLYFGAIRDDVRQSTSMFSDLANKPMQLSLGIYDDMRPFTTGEVYLSIELYGHPGGAPARIDLLTAGHLSGADLIKGGSTHPEHTGYKDTTAPKIVTDAKYTIPEEKVVFCAVGDTVDVPGATAYDVNLSGNVEYVVYRNYGKNNQTIVSTPNNKLCPLFEDVYTIVYTAKDTSGNTAQELIYVKSANTDDGRTINFEYDSQLNNVKVLDDTVVLPKFSISTLNNQIDLKLNIDITYGGKSVYSWQLANGAQISEFLNTDTYVMFEEAGEYTVTYKFADNFVNSFGSPVSYKFNVVGTDQLFIENNAFLQRMVLKGAKYAINDLDVYSYATGHQEVFAKAEAYVIFDGGNPVKIENVDALEITGSSTAQLKYVYQDATPIYSDVAKIVDVDYTASKISAYKYFTYEDNAFTIDTDERNMLFMATATEGNASMKYANAVNYLEFLLEVKIQEAYSNYDKLHLTLTDPYNTANKHVFTVINKGSEYAQFQVNGGAPITLSRTFCSASNFQFAWKEAGNALSFSGSMTSIEHPLNFSSYLAYIDLEIEGIRGASGIAVAKINKQTIYNGVKAGVVSEIVHNRELGKFTLGETITINPSFLTSVFLVPEKALTSVTLTYNNATLSALDGTKFDGRENDPHAYYQVKLDKGVGSYELAVRYDGTIKLRVFISVGDWVAPEITFTGAIKENVQVNIKANSTLKIDYVVTDDLTEVENIRHMIIIENMQHNIMQTFTEGKATFFYTGEYTVYVVAYDSEGNYAKKSFKVVVE